VKKEAFFGRPFHLWGRQEQDCSGEWVQTLQRVGLKIAGGRIKNKDVHRRRNVLALGIGGES
jgi:hypothetical protein